MCLTFIIIVIFLVISIEIEQMASCFNRGTIIIKWVMIYNMCKREKHKIAFISFQEMLFFHIGNNSVHSSTLLLERKMTAKIPIENTCMPNPGVFVPRHMRLPYEILTPCNTPLTIYIVESCKHTSTGECGKECKFLYKL